MLTHRPLDARETYVCTGDIADSILGRRIMKKTTTVLWSMVIILFALVPVARAEAPKKVAVLPFTINADRDLSFLRDGIVDMLISRLAWKDQVAAVEKGLVKKEVARHKGTIDKTKAIKVGKALNADYVVLGSLTVFGESVSMDASILDVAKAKELITAFNQSKGMDQVIPTVNRFALDINSKILGRRLVPPQYVLEPEERAVRESGPGAMEPVLAARVPFEILGIDVGDVDGDGQNEVVAIDQRTVYIYKLKANKLTQANKIPGSNWAGYVALDVADLDKNGRAEIYVTNVVGESMSSFAMEWDGRAFKELVSGELWFFRVINHPVRGECLVGQKRELTGVFSGRVCFLSIEDGDIKRGEEVLSFREANVFNFAMGDMEGKGSLDTAVLRDSGELLLVDSDGDIGLEDGGDYGGSYRYVADTKHDTAQNPEGTLTFLSPRLIMHDIDSDGKKELVLCRNDTKTGGLFDRVRLFNQGRVLFLERTVEGLEVKTQTGRLAKCVTDYQVKDADNDGRPELVVAVTQPKAISIADKGRGRIMVYELAKP